MPLEDEYDNLIENLGLCLRQARALKLQHAVHLLNMAVMEVTERSTDHLGASSASAEARSRPVVLQQV
jgi:hypothetical protein